MQYILSQKAIDRITTTPGIKTALALALTLSENSINRLIRDNDTNPNGDLTKKIALETISERSGLSEDQILTKLKVRKPAMA